MSEGRRVIRLEEFEEDESFDDLEKSTEIVRGGRKRRRLFSLRNLVLLLLLLGGLVSFAPQLIGSTPLGDMALGYLVPADKGTLRIGTRNLAWWTPVELKKIELKGPDGKVLLEVGQVKTTRTLWQIVQNVGIQQVVVDGAIVNLELRQGGSNFEDLLSKFVPAQPQPESETSLKPFEVKITNSQIAIKNDTEKRHWLISKLSADLNIAQDAKAVSVNFSGQSVDSVGAIEGGEINGTLAYSQPELMAESFAKVHNQESFRRWDQAEPGLAFSVQINKFPAGVIQTLAARVDSNLKLGGTLIGRVTGTASLTGSAARIDARQISVMNFNFAHKNWIGSDVIRQQRLDLSGGVELVGDYLQLVDTKLNSDVGKVSAKGQFAFSDIPRLINGQRLPRADISSTADIDIAGLSGQLTSTLRLRRDIKLNSGVLRWEVFNQKQNDGSIRLFADVSASGIQGQNAGTNFRWANPVRVSGAIRDFGKPIDFEKLKVESDFLVTNLNPTAEGGIDGNLVVDFDRMRTALSQVFALPPMRMQGRGNGSLKLATVRPGDKSLFSGGVHLKLQNVNLSFPGVFELEDPLVNLDVVSEFQPKQFQAADQGRHLWRFFEDPENLIVKNGSVKLTTGSQGGGEIRADTLGLSAILKRPVDVGHFLRPVSVTGTAENNAPQMFHAGVQFHGAIDRWLQIVRPLLSGIDVAATGFAQGKSDVALSGQQIQLSQLDFKANNVGFRGFGLLLNEPDLNIDGDLQVDFAKGKAKTSVLTVACRTAAIRAKDFQADYGSQIQVAGQVFFNSNVERLWDNVQRIQNYSSQQNRGAALGSTTIFDVGFLSQFLSSRMLPVSMISSGVGGQAVDRIASRLPNQSQQDPSALLMGGGWSGDLVFVPQGAGDTNLKFTSNVKDYWIGGFQPGGQKVAYMIEPKVVINSSTNLSKDFSQVKVNSFLVRTSRGDANASGVLKGLTTIPQIDLKGGLNADVINLLKPFGGAATADLAVNGLKRHQFELHGPLDTTKMSGVWLTGWDKIYWMGLDGGKANVRIEMKNGLVQTQPIEMRIGGGVIRLAPEVDMTGSSMWIRHPRGFICQNVKLTPEICRHWLKYAAPLLAQVTSVEGSFSLDSDGVEVPLSDWKRMVAKARVTINGARVGPGPLGMKISQLVRSVKTLSKAGKMDTATLSQLGLGFVSGQNGGKTTGGLGSGQLLNSLLGGENKPVQNSSPATQPSVNLAGQQNVWLAIPQQTIPIEYSKGAFRHQNLKMSVDGYSLTSQGEVRIDQTISAMADLNLPEELLRKNPQLASALGNHMKLPISGTLSNPKVDTQGVRTALLGVAQKGAQDAATKKLQSELEKRVSDKKLLDIGRGLLGSPGNGNPTQGLQKEANRLIEKNLNKGLQKIFGNR